MCDFCEALKDRNKEIILDMRNTYAGHNVCEYINDDDCSLCKVCNPHFRIRACAFNDGELGVGVDYIQQIWDREDNCVQILPSSELMMWNYCPFCGEQISEKITYHNFKSRCSTIQIKEGEN